MKTIEGIDFGRVAVLVLDYDPRQDAKNPSVDVVLAYRALNNFMREKYKFSSIGAKDVTVLANEELVAKHQQDFENSGLRFFPNWRTPNSGYRELLREGLKQGNNLFLMDENGIPVPVTVGELNVSDLEGKVDIKPKNPLFR
ncbi:MAG: hypothetical protein WC238_05735 [Parcubacteria group bacterium]|jgi:hypothetical protein